MQNLTITRTNGNVVRSLPGEDHISGLVFYSSALPVADEGVDGFTDGERIHAISQIEVAEKLGFADIIVFGSSETGTGRRGLHSALENVYEAVVAALYLDGGVDVAGAFVERTLIPKMSLSLAQPEVPVLRGQPDEEAIRMIREFHGDVAFRVRMGKIQAMDRVLVSLERLVGGREHHAKPPDVPLHIRYQPALHYLRAEPSP